MMVEHGLVTDLKSEVIHSLLEVRKAICCYGLRAKCHHQILQAFRRNVIEWHTG